MRLTQFIQQNHETIIKEWVEFASTLLPWAKGMSEKGLRDHAAELLDAVISDMSEPQSEDEQSDKSQGQALGGCLALVGHRHAVQRLGTGFNLDQLVSEYRALRASVLRLWAAEHGENEPSEMTRFNEAIDESLTEATVKFSQMLSHTKEQFLAIVGHELRNPLAAIISGATLLSESDSSGQTQRVAARILNSAGRMDRMVGELLDLTRSRLGSGIPITPKRMDLKPVCQHVIAELEASNPRCRLRFESEGDLVGQWDSDRLSQVISNLVANAIQHGGEQGTVTVLAEDHGEKVALRVHNDGPPIPPSVLQKIFEPLVRQSRQDGDDKNTSGMGLGLYIAREVVTAHGGTIDVISTEKEGTTFTVQIPRRPAAARSSL